MLFNLHNNLGINSHYCTVEMRMSRGSNSKSEPTFLLISLCSLQHPTMKGHHNLSETWHKQPKGRHYGGKCYSEKGAKKCHQGGSQQRKIWFWVLAKMLTECVAKISHTPNSLCVFMHDTWILIIWLLWEKRKIISFCFHPPHGGQQWEATRWLTEYSKGVFWFHLRINATYALHQWT